MKTILQLSFTLFASLLFLNVTLASNNLESKITLLGFDDVNNTYTIRYEDAGTGPNGGSQTYSNITYQLTASFYNASSNNLIYEEELHTIQYSGDDHNTPWTGCISCVTPGYVDYTIQLPASMACTVYTLDVRINAFDIFTNAVYIEFNNELTDGYNSYGYSECCLETGFPVEHTFENVDMITKVNDCAALQVTASQFGNYVLSNVESGSGSYTYQWGTFRGGTIVGSTTGSSIDISSAGTYCVTVTDTDINNSVTAIDCVVVTAIFSLQSPNENKTVNSLYKVYPNPTTDKLFFDLEYETPSNIIISDLSGRMIRSTETTNQKEAIDVSSLDEGMYFIQINNKNGRQTQTFVKK